MEKQSKLEKELEQEIYSQRLLVLLECPEGHFHQIKFTEENFKKVSDAVAGAFELVDKQGDMETINMILDEEGIQGDIFEGMRDFYDDGQETTG